MATPGQGRIERRLAAIVVAGMRRREFIGLLGGAAVSWPLGARAQRVHRIGFLVGLAENDPEGHARITAFRQGLEALGPDAGADGGLELLDLRQQIAGTILDRAALLTSDTVAVFP